jgi:hypothetical protein
VNEYKDSSRITYDRDHKVCADATARQLFEELYYDPCSLPCEPLVQGINVVIDDLSIIRDALDSTEPDTDTIQRIVMRAIAKLRIARHLEKKYREADSEESEDDTVTVSKASHRVYVVPMKDGVPDFENYVEPTDEVMALFDWISRPNVLLATNILMHGKTPNVAAAERLAQLADKEEVQS